MSTEYRVTSLMDFGLPGVEIAGYAFNAKDIYEFIGRKQYSTTFFFRADSPAFIEYGPNLTGFPCYDPKTKNFLESGNNPTEIAAINQLKIEVTLGELSAAQKHDLRYKGISISDIESISFLQYKPDTEFHSTGEKKIPNIVEIKADLSGLDYDILLISYFTSKHNSGVELIDFEREELVGLLLAKDDFRIDTRVLDMLGLTVEKIKDNHPIWYHAYQSLDRKGRISAEKVESFNEMKLLDSLTRMNALATELKNLDTHDSNLVNQTEQIRKIWEQVQKFKPSILMHGKQQIYWDLQSYIHIALRHVKDFQLGSFKEKTPFSYRADDVSTLIEKVLGCVEEDLRIYLAEKPTRSFKRHGSMAIEFNGDYYNISIEPTGRVEQFHMIGNA